jgi:hypothetical protein
VNRFKGFTLIEAIFVLLLIAIVVSFGMKSFSTSKDSIVQAEAVSNVDRVIASQLSWASLSGNYTSDGSKITGIKGLTILPFYTPSISGDQVSLGVTEEGHLLLAVQGFEECILFRVTPLVAGASRSQLPTSEFTACSAISAVLSGEKILNS